MRLELCRYVRPVQTNRLAAVLQNPDSVPTVPLQSTVDLSEVGWVLNQHVERATVDRSSALDGEMIAPLHKALRNLSRRDASDMRLWHWLCIRVLPTFVWSRWYGHTPETDQMESILNSKASLAEHFVGTATLHGVSRNALARLWWCAETLVADDGDYTLAREAVANQDFFQAIFERKMGLYPPTARALLRVLKGRSEGERREATKRLNHYFTTIVAEALDEDDIERLLIG